VTLRAASLGTVALAALLVLSVAACAAASDGATTDAALSDDCATAARAMVDDRTEPEVSLVNDTVSVARGDVARIRVGMNDTDTAYLSIDGPEYQATVRLHDVDGDGEVTVRFDTFAAGQLLDDVVGAPGADEVALVAGSETDLSNVLDRGVYDLGVTVSRGVEYPRGEAELRVESRSTDQLRLWRTDSLDGISTAEDVSAAIENGSIARADVIDPRTGDILITQIDATGLEGLIANQSGESTTERFIDALNDGELTLDIRQTQTRTPETSPKRLNLSAVDSDVLTVVPGDGTYYVALNTSADVLDRYDDDVFGFEQSEAYEVTFTVSEGDLTDAEDGESVSATFSTTEASTSLDKDTWTFESADNQSITGTSTHRPGTSVTIRIESQDPANPFVVRQRVTVQENGTFEAEFDLSRLPVGTNLSIRLSDYTGTVGRATGRVGDDGPSVSLVDDSVSVARGDIARLHVEMNDTDTGYLAIDDRAYPYEYQATVRLHDADGDGEVTVRFDTFAAGQYDGVVGARGVDEASLVAGSETNLSTVLRRDEYDLGVTVTRGAALEDPQDVARLRVESRSADQLRLWRTDSLDGISTAEDVAAAIENGRITRTDTIDPRTDHILIQADATGLEGLLANQSGESTTENFIDALNEGALRLDIRQTETNVPALPPKRLNLTAVDSDALTVVSGEGTYYIALNTSTDVLDRGHDERMEGFTWGENYEVAFIVPQGDLTDAPNGEVVGATFETSKASSSLDQDTWAFESAANQSITGTSTYRPGTDVTVRIESEEPNNPFVDRQRVTVQENGTFGAEFDLSTLPEGTNLSIRLSDPSGTAATATGQVPSEAAFEVSDLDAPSTTRIGDTVAVTATITNTGDLEGSTPVEFVFAGETLDTQNVTLDGGASRIVEFEVPVTDEFAAGQIYTHGVAAGEDEQTAEITIEEPTLPTPTPTPTEPPATSTEPLETSTAPPDGTPIMSDDTTTSGDDGTTTEESAGGQPGFTMGVGIVALLAAALLALRRRN